MAIAIKKIEEYISEIGGNILENERENTVSVIVFNKYHNILENKSNYLIYLLDNGELIRFVNAIGPADVGGVNKASLLEALLHYNASTKFGTWDYDKNDDQINYTVEIPLEDNTLTEKQFKRIISILENSTVDLIKMIHELKENTDNSDGI
jgi:hypothetical protein